MLMMMLFFNPFMSKFWKISINLLLMTFILMKIPMNIYMSNISINLGCDLTSMMMFFLTLFIFSLSILSMNSFLYKLYLSVMIIVLLKIIYIMFMMFNFIYFYVFFEVSLIPMMIIILGWGLKVERIQAGIYFIFYTMFSSLPLLFCLMVQFYENMSSFFFLENYFPLNGDFFFVFFSSFAFLVKLPVFLFHLWLPKAHVEAPVMGSMILAGILLKLGGYGLLRMMKILMENFYMLSYFLMSFSIWGGIMVSFSCLNQLDMKMIVAFSSISHMSILISGLYSMCKFGIYGSFLMMVSHGLTSSGLFFLVNIFYERSKSRSLIKNKGMINLFPEMSLLSFLIISSSMGIPPSINLLSEFLLFYSSIYWFNFFFFCFTFILFLSVLYSMYMYSYSQHGKMFSGIFFLKNIFLIDYMIIFFHWMPSNMMILINKIIMLII